MPRPLSVLTAVVVGGAVGTGLRVIVFDLLTGEDGFFVVPAHLEEWVVLAVVNLIGAFALGWYVESWRISDNRGTLLVPALGVGLLGSFTTFSSVMVQAVDGVRSGDGLLAIVGVAAILCGGVFLAVLGRLAANR